jgi:type IV pilus assembly protein PilB
LIQHFILLKEIILAEYAIGEDYMKNIYKKRLGDLLLDYGRISQSQLDEVLKKQKVTGKRLGEIFIDEDIVTEDDILDILEIQLGIKRVFLEMVNIDKLAVLSIPASLAEKYILIPLFIRDDKIHVAMSDPLNIFAVDDVKIASGYEVEPLLATKDDIKRFIDKFYSNKYAQAAADELSREHLESETNEDFKDREDLNDVKNAPAVRLVESIIREAVKAKASDIHIEPFERFIKVRNRIDGELQETIRPPSSVLGSLVTRIKILANLNIAEKRIPQDGRIITSVDGKDVDLRVSVLPTVHGEKIVIRVLRRDSFVIGKAEMGINVEDLEKLERITKAPYGIILVTGPTGSGKSTTLYSILSDLNTADKNIVTVEDPVEYMLEGVNQVNVNIKAGMTFAAGLRSILRQDPDIIMIGEIRDGETAEIAIRAAITGHIVLSTMHTNDSPSTPLRLIDMGIEPYLVATSIAGIISQRLVRKICPHCKEKYEANSKEKDIMKMEPASDLFLYKGKGCPFCSNTGYSGRFGIYEVMEITRDIRQLIMNNKSADDIRDLCIKKGMKTIYASCVDMVLKGATTIEELIRIAFLKE